ncbi:MAG: YqcI/YcgG family protein [Dehalococcoidia bacterium]|nr:YqcI/YcgG family protein [Dehalococcoidia bacterium]
MENTNRGRGRAAAEAFDSPLARDNTSHHRIVDGALASPRGEPERMAVEVHSALRAVLHDPDFPCVGAKSIMNQHSYRFALYDELASEGSTHGLAYDLATFVEEMATIEGEFVSFIACFKEPKPRTPKPFETLLWKQLHGLHCLDRQHFSWSEEVSSDPAEAGFSFSFAGNPFFVVGLSPSSRRWARRFPWPTLVFNDHHQFERLREERRFERIRDTIRERDTALHGEPNAMLADYGSHSEARQYAGRKVSDNWRCPVSFDGAGCAE